MSARAAWRLERLGFVAYDYAAGKVDWLAAGLATVRPRQAERRALDAADRDPPTCSPDASVDGLPGSVLVVNDHRVVLGRPAGNASTGTTIPEVGPRWAGLTSR